MHSEELGEFRFTSAPIGDSDRLFVDRAARSVDPNVVEFEEQQRGNGSGSLVAVNERMILHDMEQVSSRHLKRELMQELTPKGDLRLSMADSSKPMSRTAASPP